MSHDDIFCTVWLVVSLIGVMGTAFYAGLSESEDVDSILLIGFLGSVVWPIVLLFSALVAPLYGIYRLGQFIKKRQSVQRIGSLEQGAK
jgi:hypothetical protein